MFKLIISSGLIFCSMSMGVSAAEAASGETKTTQADNDIAIKIVQAKCQHCHGLNGEASSAIYPRLSGQNEIYIAKQLHDFRSKKRKEATMNEMAADLTDDEITALAAYFSSQPTIVHRVRDKQLAAVGEYIFQKGNQYSGVADCASCHGENGEGNELRPRLSGQHKR